MISGAGERHNILVLDNELGMGGSEKLLFDFASRYDRDRFTLAVCCLKEGGYWKDDLVGLGIPFYENLLKHRFDAGAFRRLAAILRGAEIDLIDTYVHPNTVIFSYLAKAFGLVKRFVVGFHASGNPEGGRLVPLWLKPFLSDADALIALAPAHRRYLTRVEGLNPERMEIVFNGVDTGVFRPPAQDEKKALREELGFLDSETVLVTVASLKPIKRIDLLISALTGADPRVRLLVVGDGPDRSFLEQLARRTGNRERVLFTGIRPDVNRLLRAADVLILSSRQEAFPTAVLEGMATGLPVIATNVGSVCDMVENGRSAVVVPREDRAALSSAIADLAGNREKAAALGLRGRQIVCDRFDVDGMCATRQRLFEKVLAGS